MGVILKMISSYSFFWNWEIICTTIAREGFGAPTIEYIGIAADTWIFIIDLT